MLLVLVVGFYWGKKGVKFFLDNTSSFLTNSLPLK